MNEINRKETLFDEYLHVMANYKKALEGKKTLLDQQKEEMDAVKEKYRLPLIDVEQNIKSNLQAVHEFNNLLTNYSTFNEHMITDTICLLIHIVERQNFLYQNAQHYIGFLRHGLWGGQGEEGFNLWPVRLIVNEEKRKDKYYRFHNKKDEVMELINAGDAILLQDRCSSDPSKDDISFYFLDDNHNIVCSSDFGRFGYVKNFIDFVIQYRFFHELKEISRDDIVLCMQLFIKDNKELIVNNFDSRVQARILKL